MTSALSGYSSFVSIGCVVCFCCTLFQFSRLFGTLWTELVGGLLTCIVWQLCAISQIGLHVFPRCCSCFANRRVPDMPHQIIPPSSSITSGGYPRILHFFLSIYLTHISYCASYSHACQLRGPVYNMDWTINYYRLAHQKRLFLPPCQFTNPWVICAFDRIYLHYECMCW